jgi:predicted nicotinamide N-methyase
MGSTMQGCDPERTVYSITELSTPALCPEVRLRLKPASDTFEEFRSRLPPRVGAAPPYWAVAWPGGQALGRYLIDNNTSFGLRVADLGTGCGLAAIAAMLSGASSALATDCDPMALAATRCNATANAVTVDAVPSDLATTNLEGVHVVLAGDLWYEPLVARRATEMLRRCAAQGLLVLAGDPRRSYFPRSRCRLLATYRVAASLEFERGSEIETDVWRFEA